MPDAERVYSVLLVSAAKNVNDAIRELLQETLCVRLSEANSVGAAKRKLAEQSYDLVLVNSPLPDDTGIRFAVDAASGSTVALLLVRAELLDEITDRVLPHGVFTLPKPSSRLMLQTAFHWLASARECLRKTEKKAVTLEEKMAEIRLVNRAKWLLIDREGMDEPTAHRYIEKQAMDRCVSKLTVAEQIVQRYS